MELPDDDQDDELSEEAWEIARRIAASAPSDNWPPLPSIIGSLEQFLTSTQFEALKCESNRALNEVYFYGLVYASLTMDIRFDVQGARLRMPALLEVGEADAGSRLISYEGLLPFMDRPVSKQEAKWLADRLRGLAAICDKKAKG